MKTRLLILALALFALSLSGNAQEAKKRIPGNTVAYLEGGGPGVIMSVNIDQRLSFHKATGPGLRVGIGFGRYKHGGLVQGSTIGNVPEGESLPPISETKKTYLTIPFTFNWVIMTKKPSSSIEIGVGGTFLSEKVPVYNRDNEPYEAGRMLWHATVLYRYIPTTKGVTIRPGVMVIRGTAGDIMPFIAFGIGYSF